MDQDTEETPVLFREMLKRLGGDVIAIFPTQAESLNPYECGSYAHVGQHGTCDPQYLINSSRWARPEEYADLKAELEGPPYGYRLRVYRRTQSKWLRQREAQCRKYRDELTQSSQP
jgi:hypothetical protein